MSFKSYTFFMEIVETKIYTKYITELLNDDQYRDLQKHLVEFPKSGDVIRGSGGLRKLRWVSKGKGKSGGIRCKNRSKPDTNVGVRPDAKTEFNRTVKRS